jgi:beta-glucosidase
MPEPIGRRQFLVRAAGASLALTTPSMAATAGTGAPDLKEDPMSAKVEALLRSMTLDEKIGQMTQVDMKALKDKAHIQKYSLGSMLSGGDSDPPDITAAGWAKAYDEYQTWGLKTRLKIPLLYGIDAVHGHNNVDGAVIFPHNIGLGATRSPELVEKAAGVIAREVAGTGIGWTFAPCIAVARDERWGRTYESFGETPELAEMLGSAAVRGFQGERLSGRTSILACAKHFLGDGGTTNGIDQGNTECDEATLRKIHLAGYIAAIKSGVGSIMVSFSSWNGKKMHANKYLLTNVLKGELGFPGFLVSDWAAIDQLSSNYKTAIDTAINAGLDMIMIPNGPGQKNNYVDFIGLLKELVAEGKVPQARIDDAVGRILRIKLKTKLFDHPLTDSSLTESVGCDEHRQVARECVRQSLVLLKNDKQALPLSPKARRLHVAGKAADDLGIQCGGWTIDWQGRTGKATRGGTTILAAIRRSVASGTEVTFSPEGTGAKAADAAIVVIGELPYAESFGDRKDLSLAPGDLALVKKVKEAGVPLITVLLSGRPLIVGPALAASDAFVVAWLPGTEGQGVADVLFGVCKPKGKLPHTWPRSMAQVPCNVGDRIRGKPLFPYGFGLGY